MLTIQKKKIFFVRFDDLDLKAFFLKRPKFELFVYLVFVFFHNKQPDERQ